MGNLSLETIFVMVAGFLMGAVPAFIIIGFYFGRKVEKEHKALKLSYERQITALRATVKRLMDRIDLLVEERNRLRRSSKVMRDAIREQNNVTEKSNAELDDARQNMVRMQERIDELQAQNLHYEGRLDQADAYQKRMEAQLQRTIEHFTQTRRMQQNLIFATSQLRETKAVNEALEAGFLKELKPVPEDQESVSPEQLDVSIIEGLEPVYAQRLYDSGIHTISDLARQTPARVAHFAGLSTWDDSAAWIAEARIRLATSTQAQN